MNVLYIGATGLVGSHVVPFLAEKFHLTLTGYTTDKVNGMEVLPLDLTQWDATETLIKNGATNGQPFDAVVYCATANYRENNQSDPDGRHRYYENCIEVNARGAYHVFEAAWRAGVSRVVHIGSMTAMLGQPVYEYIDHDTLDRPNDLYAATKIFGENVGRSYVFRPRRRRQLEPETEQRMQVICLRLGQPFSGETHWRRSPHNPSRLAAHMEDIAGAIECALRTDIPYGIYPVVSDVENPLVDPSTYAELGYQPLWRFDSTGVQRKEDASTTESLPASKVAS